jgi:hypothetical protein
VPLLQFIGFGTQRLVRQLLQRRLERVDRLHGVRVLLEQALVAAAEHARRQAPKSLEKLAQGFHGWRRKPPILLEKPTVTCCGRPKSK